MRAMSVDKMSLHPPACATFGNISENREEDYVSESSCGSPISVAHDDQIIHTYRAHGLEHSEALHYKIKALLNDAG